MRPHATGHSPPGCLTHDVQRMSTEGVLRSARSHTLALHETESVREDERSERVESERRDAGRPTGPGQLRTGTRDSPTAAPEHQLGTEILQARPETAVSPALGDIFFREGRTGKFPNSKSI